MTNTHSSIATEEFKLKSSTYSQFVIRRIISKCWYVILIPIIIIILAGIYINYFWYFLLPLFICIVYPLLLFFSFVKLGFTREAGESLYLHRIILTPNEVIFEPSVNSQALNDDEKSTPNLKSHSYKLEDLKGKELYGQYIVLTFHSKRSEFVMIPQRVIPIDLPQEIREIWLPL